MPNPLGSTTTRATHGTSTQAIEATDLVKTYATGRGKPSMTCSGALDLKGTYDEHFRGGIG